MMADTQPQVDVNADRTTTVRLSGEVRADTLAAVREAFDSVVGSGPLIVDLSAVTYLDGAAVALLFEVAAERSLELVVGPGCAVFSIVAVSGLDQVAVVR